MPYLLADERLYSVIVQVDGLLPEFFSQGFLYLAHYMSACEFADELCGTSAGPVHNQWIRSPLIPERCIGLQPVPLGCHPDGHRVEVCALEEDRICGFDSPGLLSAEHTGKTHRLPCIGNQEVVCGKGAFHSIESDELLPFFRPADNDFPPCNFRCIESMERLSDLHKHEIGNVDYIVYRTESDSPEPLLHPVRRWSHLDTCQCCSSIFGSAIRSLHLHRNCPIKFGGIAAQPFIAFSKGRHIRDIEAARDIVQFQICIQVTGHPDM